MAAVMRQVAVLVLAALALGSSGTWTYAQTLNLGTILNRAPGLDITNLMGGEASGASLGGFEAFERSLWPDARAKGVSRATFDRAFAGIAPDPDVLEKASRQAEFVKPVWEYLQSTVSQERIANGRAMLEEHRGLLDAIEARYGVSRHILVAIWGMESNYGKVLNDPEIVKPVIRSLATLAHLDPRRRRFGRSQLIAALRILENGDTTVERMSGSWAGAMGHTQFIPTTYLAYAVDFDGDGRRDIWDTIADALASTAHYLEVSGWQTGETWGYEVDLPDGFDYRLASGEVTKSLGEWHRLGVTRTRGRAFPRPGDRGRLLVPAGASGPAFLMLGNFRVIKRYNNADAYALAVGHLADRLQGGEQFVAAWPLGEQPLVSDEHEELQRLLKAAGFDPGGVDGKIGPKTQRALRAYQSSIGMTPDGYATKSLLDRLRNRS